MESVSNMQMSALQEPDATTPPTADRKRSLADVTMTDAKRHKSGNIVHSDTATEEKSESPDAAQLLPKCATKLRNNLLADLMQLQSAHESVQKLLASQQDCIAQLQQTVAHFHTETQEVGRTSVEPPRQ